MSSRQNQFPVAEDVTAKEYQALKQRVDHYINRIRVYEQNRVLKNETIAEFELFLDGFHTSPWSLKTMFYALMKKRMASWTDESLQAMWERYVIQSASLDEQRQQLANRGRSEEPAQLPPYDNQLPPPRYNSLSERGSSLRVHVGSDPSESRHGGNVHRRLHLVNVDSDSSRHGSSGTGSILAHADSNSSYRRSVNSGNSVSANADSDSSRHGSLRSQVPQQSSRGTSSILAHADSNSSRYASGNSVSANADSDSSRHGSVEDLPQQSSGPYEMPSSTSQNNAPLFAHGRTAPNAGHPQGPGGGRHLVPGSGFLGPPAPGFTGPYGPGHGQAVASYPPASVHPAVPGYHNNPRAVYPTNPSNPTGPSRRQGPPPDVVHAANQYPTSSAYQHHGGARYQH